MPAAYAIAVLDSSIFRGLSLAGMRGTARGRSGFLGRLARLRLACGALFLSCAILRHSGLLPTSRHTLLPRGALGSASLLVAHADMLGERRRTGLSLLVTRRLRSGATLLLTRARGFHAAYGRLLTRGGSCLSSRYRGTSLRLRLVDAARNLRLAAARAPASPAALSRRRLGLRLGPRSGLARTSIIRRRSRPRRRACLRARGTRLLRFGAIRRGRRALTPRSGLPLRGSLSTRGHLLPRMHLTTRRAVPVTGAATTDDHLHLSYLATFRFKPVDDAAHTPVNRDDPNDQKHNRHRENNEADEHERKWRCENLGQVASPCDIRSDNMFDHIRGHFPCLQSISRRNGLSTSRKPIEVIG